MTQVEKVARAMCPNAWHQTTYENGTRFTLVLWEEEQARAIKLALTAIEEMRDYSEAMSQEGGGVGKYGIIPLGPNNPTVGQSIAERCYLAMIDEAIREHKEAQER